MATMLEANAMLEILRAYYVKIGWNENTITVSEILNMMESDIEHLEGERAIELANEILKPK